MTSTYSSIAIVIPSLEPGSSLLPLLSELHDLQFGEIIVIDDGSSADYAAVFESARTDFGCTILTHEVNRGKGRALKTAYAHVRENSAITDIVTADADGQHLPTDIAAVADRLLENRTGSLRALVLGTRDFNAEQIPWKSRFGNKFSSGLVRVLFGRYVSDTQTGLRGIPVELLPDLSRVKGERFEYEMNALLRMLTVHAPVQELPISTVYHDMDNSQSHFRPVRDSIQVFAQIVRFATSSLLGSLVDLALYALIVNVFFNGSANPVGIITAVAIARVASSLLNFVVNRQIVFHDGSSVRTAILRYYLLALGLLIVSAGGSALMAQVLGGHVVWAKIIVDTLLFAVSYLIQKRWVFEHDNSLSEK
jgi:glycosyltransferase involved in cell wall biosynthesis